MVVNCPLCGRKTIHLVRISKKKRICQRCVNSFLEIMPLHKLKRTRMSVLERLSNEVV